MNVLAREVERAASRQGKLGELDTSWRSGKLSRGESFAPPPLPEDEGKVAALSQFDSLVQGEDNSLSSALAKAVDAANSAKLVQGYLSKKAGGKHEAKSSSLASLTSAVGTAWRRRFFVLEPNSSALVYYKKEEHCAARRSNHPRLEPSTACLR